MIKTKTLLIAALALFATACGDNDSTTFTPARTAAYPHDAELRLNQMQVLGTHNSYHIQAEPAVLTVIKRIDVNLAKTLEYTHRPLNEQLESEGIRQLELDVWADPNGGLFANRRAYAILHRDPASGIPELSTPGFKVLHVQDLDFLSTCWTFVECLQTIKAWSDDHPLHVPIMIEIEAKDDKLPGQTFTVPIPFGPAEFDALDAEIRSVLPPEKIITPDDVRGAHATLEEAVRSDGWPTLGKSRGRLLFTLDNDDHKKTDYIAGHPSLAGRVLFTSSRPGEPEAGFVKLNDPIGDHDLIHDLVAQGFIVRTRSDADTIEARSGDTAPREAALSSGAQFVSTDYPVPDPAFGTGYFVAIPGGTPARCNPVSAPPQCTSLDIENPAHLVFN